MTKQGRIIEKTIDIPAPPEAVWRALSDAEEITRWFAPEAKVTPGAGGHIWLSWGPGFEGDSRIQVWEPGRHLQTVEVARPITLDYYLESKDGATTRLRLVHSGFGDDASWDNELNNVTKGWEVFLRNLAHYLAHHAGEPCRQVQFVRSFSMPLESTWQRLLGAAWLGVGTPQAGAPYRAQTAMGDELRGTCDLLLPPNCFGASVENLRGRINLDIEAMQGTTFLFATLLLYGGRDVDVARWNAQLDRALG